MADHETLFGKSFEDGVSRCSSIRGITCDLSRSTSHNRLGRCAAVTLSGCAASLYRDRVGEALGASTTDYGHDAGHRTLTIRRKGGRHAKVAVPAPAAIALNEYLETNGAELIHVIGEGAHHLVGQPLFTTIALDTGTSLHALQDSMGHADPRTTRRYDRACNNLTKSASYNVARALT